MFLPEVGSQPDLTPLRLCHLEVWGSWLGAARGCERLILALWRRLVHNSPPTPSTKPAASRRPIAQSMHGPQLGDQRLTPFPGQLCLPWVLEAPWRQSHDFLRTRSSAPGAWLHREPGCVRTGTVPAPHRLCQPHTSCLDVLPVAAVFSFLALWGGSGPAQHPWCSSCLHPSPSNCLGLVTARGGEQRV